MPDQTNRQISRRDVLKGLAAGAVGVIAAACQPKTVIVEKEKIVKETVIVEGQPKEVTKIVEVAAKGPTEISVYVGFVGAHGQVGRRTKEYNGSQDKVKMIEVPVGEDWETKLRAQIEKGPPEIEGITSHHFFRMLALWANLGIVQPIEEFLNANSIISVDEYWGDMFDLDNFKWDTSWKGKVYGVPMAIDTTAQGYMKSHFEAAGLSPAREDRAQTWDEVLDHAIALREWGKDDGVWGMYGWRVYHQTAGAIFQSISTDLYTDDDFINVDSEDFRRTMRIMNDWVENDVAPNPPWLEAAHNVGRAGKMSQWQSTMGTTRRVKEVWGSIAVAEPMPTLAEPTGTGGQHFYLTGGYLFAKAQHPQEVVDWLLWLYGPQNDVNADIMVNDIKWFPVFKSQWKKQIEDKPENHYMLEFDRYYSKGKLIPKTLHYEIEWKTIQKYCELYFSGELSVEEASQKCDEEMRAEAAKIKVE